MAFEFRMTRQVEFAETDMAGIVHFSRFFLWMESVEHAFWRSLGFSVHGEDGDVRYGFPRVHAECDFKAPVRFEDQVEAHLSVVEKRQKKISFEIVFSKLDDAGKPTVELARGLVTVVCVAMPKGGEPMRSIPIPPRIDAAIEVAPQRQPA